MKKRILFVEDDPLLRQLYGAMLSDEADRWDVSAAADGPAALELMDRAAFDVIVSDLNMPGMSGIDLINQVRQRHPRSSRIILSALDDQEKVARLLGATHQFLAKPFSVRDLKATLARIGGLDAYLSDETLKALIGRLGVLPSFPALYLQIVKELDGEDPSVERIASIIATDPAMTAKMLQIVNSAALGLARKISRPFEAVQFLGMATVRSLVLSAHIFASFDAATPAGLPVDRLWRHAIRSGALARRIMQLEQADPAEAEDAYTAGVLHDVGKLVLACSLPAQFQRVLGLAAGRRLPFCEAELEVYGATHAGAAAYLLGLWGLPAPIVEAVAFHHAPRRSDLRAFGLLTAVHAANVLEHELSQDNPAEAPAGLDLDYLASIHLDHRLETWRAEVRKTSAPAAG